MSLPEWITFDCYDTLIDFAIDPTTTEILGSRANGIAIDAFLATFSEARKVEEAPPWKPYRVVLVNALRRAMDRHGIPYRDEDGASLVAAVSTWGPHPDVPPALERLRRGCKLAILTNSDDDIVAGNLAKIGVPFDRVVTAEQVKAYKPALETFRYVLDSAGCPPERAWHVAQDFWRDIVPAAEIGYDQRVWIHRYGLTGDPSHPPDHELPNLERLPDLLGL